MNARGIPPAAWQVLAMLIHLLTTGVLHLVLDGGSSHPGLDWVIGILDGRIPPVLILDGMPPIQTWDGYPPLLNLGWGTPTPSTGWDTPCLDLGQGTPHPDLGRGTPIGRWGTPPSWCELTHRLKILPSPILQMQALNILVKG